jgi:hypothetical protein
MARGDFSSGSSATGCERLFWTALFNDINAARLAMRKIRRVPVGERLIQTDLGYCRAKPPFQWKADSQNVQAAE